MPSRLQLGACCSWLQDRMGWAETIIRFKTLRETLGSERVVPSMPVPVAQGFGDECPVVRPSLANTALVVWLLRSCLNMLLFRQHATAQEGNADRSETRVGAAFVTSQVTEYMPAGEVHFRVSCPEGGLCCSRDTSGKQSWGRKPHFHLSCFHTDFHAWTRQGCTSCSCFVLACVPPTVRIVTTSYSHLVPFLHLPLLSARGGDVSFFHRLCFIEFYMVRIMNCSRRFYILFPSCLEYYFRGSCTSITLV